LQEIAEPIHLLVIRQQQQAEAAVELIQQMVRMEDLVAEQMDHLQQLELEFLAKDSVAVKVLTKDHTESLVAAEAELEHQEEMMADQQLAQEEMVLLHIHHGAQQLRLVKI
jgi:hypothetical protein